MSNMLDILKNFDDASKGNKPAGAPEVGSMKAILESMNNIEECGTNEGMPGEMPAQGQPVTVSVTASGKDNVADLIGMMQAAAGITQMGPGVEPADPQDMDMAAMKKAIMGQEEIENEDYANEPDEEYKDVNFMTKDMSGGLNREKPRKAIRVKDPAVESIKERLWNDLNNKKNT
jgi:hypothetical protein